MNIITHPVTNRSNTTSTSYTCVEIDEVGHVVAKWLSSLLDEYLFTPKQLALEAKLPRITLHKILKGGNPNLSTLERIAKTLAIELPANVADAALERYARRGLSRVDGVERPEYRAFIDMHKRVSNPKDARYPRYGGAGTTIDQRWANTPEGFLNFVEDVGLRPSNQHSLHRSPPHANYGPDTAKWDTKKIQAIEQNGKTVFVVNGDAMTLNQFIKQSEKDGFACVVRFKRDGTVKKRRKRRTQRKEAAMVNKPREAKRETKKHRAAKKLRSTWRGLNNE